MDSRYIAQPAVANGITIRWPSGERGGGPPPRDTRMARTHVAGRAERARVPANVVIAKTLAASGIAD
jgi:hypothetical protein